MFINLKKVHSMKYKQLTQEQTDIWISNLDKTTDLIFELKDYYFNVMDMKKKEEFNKYYKNSFKWKWFYDHSFNDLILTNDGWHHACLITGISKLEKITQYNSNEMNIHNYLINNSHKLLDTTNKMVKTQKMWEIYAHQPFQIDVNDLQMYFLITETHKKVKDLLIGVNAYNEAFNLDEDS